MKSKHFEKKWYAEFLVRYGVTEYIVPVTGIYDTKTEALRAVAEAQMAYMECVNYGCTFICSNAYQRLTRK